MDGFLFVNKPVGMTSFSCVSLIRKTIRRSDKKPTDDLIRNIKVGHAGTLDMAASGLLIVAIGRATKLIKYLMELDKKYIVTAEIGLLTDSLDLNGNILKKSCQKVKKEDLESAIDFLGSSYWQIPPVYSALKYNGKSLSILARESKFTDKELQKIVEQKKRLIDLYSLRMIDFSFPYFTLNCHVSHGTYIRSLANDISRKAKSFATTIDLARTAIGPYEISQAVELSMLRSSENILEHLHKDKDVESVVKAYSKSRYKLLL